MKKIKEICSVREDFASDFQKIEEAYINYMQLLPGGEIEFQERKFKLRELRPYQSSLAFGKKKRKELEANLGLTYDGLVEINKKIIDRQEILSNELKKAVDDFVRHYCSAF